MGNRRNPRIQTNQHGVGILEHADNIYSVIKSSKAKEVDEALRLRVRREDWLTPTVLIPLLLSTVVMVGLGVIFVATNWATITDDLAQGRILFLMYLIVALALVIVLTWMLMGWAISEVQDAVRHRSVSETLIIDVSPADARLITAREARAVERADSSEVLREMCVQIKARQDSEEVERERNAQLRAAEAKSIAQAKAAEMLAETSDE